MQRLDITGLPPVPSAAAAAFYAEWLEPAARLLASGEGLTLVFPPAGHEHSAWRLSAVQSLAREHAPRGSMRWPATTKRESRRLWPIWRQQTA